jgi:hypothetical protein
LDRPAFGGLAYGEVYCGGWLWRYFGGESGTVFVGSFDHAFFLPLLLKD